ncbi:MAG: L,D-transpeptidase family protein [Pseudomonadales bacterium]
MITSRFARSLFTRSLLLLLVGVVGAPTVHAAAYSLPDADTQVVGAVTTIRARYEDTLASIAEQHGLGYKELIRANPEVDPWLPGEGTPILLPTAYVLPSAPREGVVINVAELRLYYYPPNRNMVITYPVGLGRQDFRTPLGTSRITMAIENPSWTPTATSRREHAERGDPLPPVVPPGPDNPLGSRALQLDIPGYYIHGTNQPFGVGQMVSQGCIRLYEPHIVALTELVARGTVVRIINEPYKVGWRDGQLFVEVHEDIYAEHDPVAFAGRVRAALAAALAAANTGANTEAKKSRASVVDWARLDEVLKIPTGLPVRI